MDPITIGLIVGAVKEELPGLFGKSKREAEAERRAISIRQAGLTPGAGIPQFGALPDTDTVGSALKGAAIGSMFAGGGAFGKLGKGAAKTGVGTAAKAKSVTKAVAKPNVFQRLSPAQDIASQAGAGPVSTAGDQQFISNLPQQAPALMPQGTGFVQDRISPFQTLGYQAPGGY